MLKAVVKAAIYTAGVLSIIAFVAYDSRQHFDAELIELKKQANSGQRNWSLFYGQSNVYQNGGLRHADDFAKLAPLLEENSAIFTDIATSYYLASSLPAYVKNVHRHHGRWKSPEWNSLITARTACWIDVPDYLARFKEVLAQEQQVADRRGLPPVRYIAINNTDNNINFKRDCLSQRRGAIRLAINKIGDPVFEGDSVSIYKINDHRGAR
ncbi:MAG: hypothetical protein KTR16_02835 [Acidiferrobacterales bacterium]|nr:hypothetical protein [Acidiferrobacterales bacterium]